MCIQVVHPEWTSQYVIAALGREVGKWSLACEPRPHTELPPIWEDQQFAMLKSLGMFSEFQQPLRSKAVVGLGRSTVRGMSSVMQRDDDDDNERTEDDAGALQYQIDLLTQRLAKVKDAGDKDDFESVGADVGDTLQDNPAASPAVFHQVHTPRQEQDTSSKLDGDQDCERNEKRTTFSGPVFSRSHGQGTPKFALDQGSARVMRRNSFSGPESSTKRQSSLFVQETSGHLATVYCPK